MKKVAVLQSNYIPWRGYFDIIHDADEFIFYDEVQYTTGDWRNRNKIYTHDGLKWLSIPCGKNIKQSVDKTKINNTINWQTDHWNKILLNYGKAPYFNIYKDFFEDFYLNKKWEYLSESNQYLIKHISKNFLGIKTVFTNSHNYPSNGDRTERLLSLLELSNTDISIVGPSAKNYIDDKDFTSREIKVVWKDYSGYPEYKQWYKPFESNVSIIDLLFFTGPDAPYYIWDWRK